VAGHEVPQVPARARLTASLRQAAGAAVADANRTIVQTARDYEVSWLVVAAAFTANAERVLPVEPDPVTVLGSTRSAGAAHVGGAGTNAMVTGETGRHGSFTEAVGRRLLVTIGELCPFLEEAGGGLSR
jgi:hypothetical protein